MAESEASIVVKRDIDSVFSVADTYPSFVDFYFNKQILDGDCSSVRKVRMCARFFGNVIFCWEGTRTKCIKNSEIEWVQTEGLLKGLKAVWLFASQSGVTHVTLKCFYNPSVFLFGSLLGYLANVLFIHKTLPRLLSSLRVACEASSLKTFDLSS